MISNVQKVIAHIIWKLVYIFILFSFISCRSNLPIPPRPTPLPNTIPHELRIDIPQSLLGTCSISKQSDFNMATWGISPCVGLTYFSECAGDDNTFTILGHFDSSHINFIGNYLTELIERIPSTCENGTFTVNIVDPMDKLFLIIEAKLKELNQKVLVERRLAKGFGVDLAINTRNGNIKLYKNLTPKQTEGDVELNYMFNRIDSDCYVYYIGKERLCRLQSDYKLGFKYRQGIHQNKPNSDLYYYAFIPSKNPKYLDSCLSEDIELKD
jgi:hypothetical protein